MTASELYEKIESDKLRENTTEELISIYEKSDKSEKVIDLKCCIGIVLEERDFDAFEEWFYSDEESPREFFTKML